MWIKNQLLYISAELSISETFFTKEDKAVLILNKRRVKIKK